MSIPKGEGFSVPAFCKKSRARDRGGKGTPGTTSSTSAQPGDGRACPAFRPMITGQVLDHESTVLSPSQCEAKLGIACYTAPQLRSAYNVGPLYKRGITGAGQTIM